jgi:hypothetical protein
LGSLVIAASVALLLDPKKPAAHTNWDQNNAEIEAQLLHSPAAATAQVDEPAQQVEVTVVSDLQDAELMLNGEARGPLTPGVPLQLLLAPGAYRFEAHAHGSIAAVEVATVRPDVPLAVRLLAPAPAVAPEQVRASPTLADAKPARVPAPPKQVPQRARELLETPTREETLAAMRGVESDVRACAEPDTAGTAEAAINVAGDSGRVTSATITGIIGSVGSCIARAVRNAKFPRFTRSAFSIRYPYHFVSATQPARNRSIDDLLSGAAPERESAANKSDHPIPENPF